MLLLRLGVATVLMVIGWSPGVSAVASPAVPTFAVSVVTTDGTELLSVTARGVALRALLSEVARRAGFEITGMGATERMVSAEFERLPLERALRRLLAGESFIFVYDQSGEGGAAKLRRVILLSSGPPLQSPASHEQEAAPPAVAEVAPASEEADQALPEDAQAFNPDAPLDQLLPWTAHQDPRMRTAALEALSLHDGDEQARQLLMEHIRDPDPQIRSVVLGLLGPFVTQWPGAEEVLVTALHDAAPGVRQLALLTLWEASSSRLSDALHHALEDADSGVRAQAKELLRDVAGEDPNGHSPSMGTLSSPGGLRE
jgi:hypothetical protein